MVMCILMCASHLSLLSNKYNIQTCLYITLLKITVELPNDSLVLPTLPYPGLETSPYHFVFLSFLGRRAHTYYHSAHGWIQ